MEHIGWRYKFEKQWVYTDGTDCPLISVPEGCKLEKVYGEPSYDNLDEALKANGMYTTSELLSGNLPVDQFMAHIGVVNIEAFETWVDRKTTEYQKMFLRYETNNKEKDELYEWVFSHYGVFKEVRANLKKALNK